MEALEINSTLTLTMIVNQRLIEYRGCGTHHISIEFNSSGPSKTKCIMVDDGRIL